LPEVLGSTLNTAIIVTNNNIPANPRRDVAMSVEESLGLCPPGDRCQPAATQKNRTGQKRPHLAFPR
jgi:hypothetical protein